MNQDEKTMAEWLAHPMEYNHLPEELREIHREKTEWPLCDEKVELVFHEYKMDGKTSGIGMTGPITWSFIGDDLKGFSFEELKKMYAGWYVSFLTLQAENYSRKAVEKAQKQREKNLKKNVPGFDRVVDFLLVGDLEFYAYKMKGDPSAGVVCVFDADRLEYEAGSKYLRLPPLYYFIGDLFFSGKL